MIRKLASLALLSLTLAGCGPTEPQTTGGPAVTRRLTESQYRSVIADVFGPQIVVAGRFDPLLRTDGLLTIGAGSATVGAAAFERFHALARSIAAQVTDTTNRDVLVGCGPQDLRTADDSCATEFYSRIGRLLFRRPLTTDEVRDQVKLAREATAVRGDFYTGLAYGLQTLLEAPDFLFVVERANGKQLDDYAKATRLSLLLWNTSPDDVLLQAAEGGKLKTEDGLKQEVDRMIASPRFKDGVRAFFTDMLSLDDTTNLQKDTTLFPAFTLTAANDGKEQTLRTLVDLLVTRNVDYRDIFTTRETHISNALGLIYRVGVNDPSGWSRFDFPSDDPRAGIQSQVGFVALHSHPGKSSPTLRGKAIRELLLCQRVPDPPGNVNFDKFNDPDSPLRTARERLAAHANDPACAGCHKLTDPIGLALENFDGLGQIRDNENGAALDLSGDLDGVKYANGAELAKALHDNPAAASCVVNRAFTYAAGRQTVSDEKAFVVYLEKTFADSGYKFPSLIRRIALSDAFYAVSGQGAGQSPAAAKAGTTEDKS